MGKEDAMLKIMEKMEENITLISSMKTTLEEIKENYMRKDVISGSINTAKNLMWFCISCVAFVGWYFIDDLMKIPNLEHKILNLEEKTNYMYGIFQKSEKTVEFIAK